MSWCNKQLLQCITSSKRECLCGSGCKQDKQRPGLMVSGRHKELTGFIWKFEETLPQIHADQGSTLRHCG